MHYGWNSDLPNLETNLSSSYAPSSCPFLPSITEKMYTPPIQCDLMIAESTIPNAGLGIFSTVDLQEGSSVGNGDKAIPIIDTYWHNDQVFFYPLIDYTWDGNSMGMSEEVSDGDVDAYWPGLDCMINCNLALLNVEKATPVYDDGGLHRAEHPGAGAISPYNKGTTKVIRPVPAGGELFKYYGDHWYVRKKVLLKNSMRR